MGKSSQAEMDALTGRSFRQSTAWCWNLQPSLPPATTIHHTVLIDGIWIGTWCLLIAVTEDLHVLAWQWCGRESTAAWAALLEQIEAPAVVVSDGGTGISTAVKTTWPETVQQRCLFHVHMNIRQYLTKNPRTDAGRALLGLSKALSRVDEAEDAIAWQLKLEQWWQLFKPFVEERTYDGHRWWYTHDRLRKAWNLLARLTRNGTLFRYIDYGNVRTTSALEGGINNGIRRVLNLHRGMSEEHMKRAAEWWLTLQETPISEAHKFMTTTAQQSETAQTERVEEPDGPELYGTTLTAEEGLWLRSGWAGRA